MTEKPGVAPRLPIVVTSPVEYFVFQHYAPEHWRSRLVCVSDADKCLQVINPKTNGLLVRGKRAPVKSSNCTPTLRMISSRTWCPRFQSVDRVNAESRWSRNTRDRLTAI